MYLSCLVTKNGNRYGVTINEMPNILTYGNLKCGCTVIKCKEVTEMLCIRISTTEALCTILKELLFCFILLGVEEEKIGFVF